jgi:sec-independent protein translocase protein TatC
VIFIGAAVMTPPDVISQALMALPMLVLYEVSILLAKLVVRKKQAPQA